MENRKHEDTLKSIFDSLSDEQKEKVKDCKTMNELIAFLDETGTPLPDELMDQVAGGQDDDELYDPDQLEFDIELLGATWDRYNEYDKKHHVGQDPDLWMDFRRQIIAEWRDAGKWLKFTAF